MSTSSTFVPSLRKFLAILACGLVPLAAWADDIAQIKTAKGSVFVERDGQRLPAKVGMALQVSDTIITGTDSSMGVTFVDNSLLSLGPNSELAIERYAFDSTTNDGVFDSALRKGTLTAVSGKIVKQTPGAMRVKTPSSILGARGTDFVVQVKE